MLSVTYLIVFLNAFADKHVSDNQSACVTNSRWRIRSSLNDRIYIFLILILCFGFPTLAIITSYVAILLTVSAAVLSWHSLEDLGAVSVLSFF